MKLIITDHILKKELANFSLAVIKKAAHKALTGLAKEIKSPIQHSSFRKVNITHPSAGRSLFLVTVKNSTAILVLIRQKNDKEIVTNLLLQNPKFQELIKRRIPKIREEIRAQKFKEYRLN